MRALTEVRVERDARGRSVATVLRCESPLLVRAADEPGDALALSMVGGAAGPLGGDHLRLCVHVGEGARVIVRSVGATMVQPGTSASPSRSDVLATVAAGGHLDWWPEPTVSVRGSDHRSRATIELADGATLRWVDEISLGRFGEPSGRLSVRQRLEIAGTVVVDHETELGDEVLAGPGAHGRGRCVLSALVVGADAPTAPRSVVEPAFVRAELPVRDGVALITCIATDRHDRRFGLTV